MTHYENTKELTDFERIRVGGKTYYLSDTSEVRIMGKLCLKGTECDKNANLRVNRLGAYVDHIIELRLIEKRTECELSRKYCELEAIR